MIGYANISTDKDYSSEELVMQHAELVSRIAYHLADRLPSTVDVNDLLQSGMVGLLEGASNFDASRGASFETYAGIRVRGAMLDEVRHADWSPRSLHRKLRQVTEAMREIENATGRDAKDSEVAEGMSISLDEFHTIMRDASSARIFSLDQAEEDGHPLNADSDEAGPLSILQQEGFQAALVKCIAELPEREQMIMSLYYNDELNLKEIGQVLDVSESRVCQLHGQALSRIRTKLSDWTGK